MRNNCKGCVNRVIGCHSWCESGQAQDTRNAEILKKRSEYNGQYLRRDSLVHGQTDNLSCYSN